MSDGALSDIFIVKAALTGMVPACALPALVGT
jgi:hypothetical protein